MEKKAILLVDDEAIILKSLGANLTAEGYRVTTAESGETAIAEMEQGRFDLVITDLVMEGIDGIHVLKQARKIAPALPVIILTGHGDMTSAIDALRLGADDYLLKPCDIHELVFRMGRCFEKQDLLEQLKVQNRKLLAEIAARKQAEEGLQESSEKIKRFAYSVSHDLKSPAIGLNGLIKLLHRHFYDDFPQKAKTYCDQVVKTSEQILELVDSINTYMSTRETPLTIEKINPEEILRSIREEFVTRLAERGITWSAPEQMPEIAADKLSLLRLFRNLVDNALKHGGDQLSEIAISYTESPEFHVISVKDDGIGMEMKDSHKIFGLFQRKKTSKAVEGVGLGLAIVKEIAKQHGGEVEMVSSKNKGAVFYVSLAKDLPLSD